MEEKNTEMACGGEGLYRRAKQVAIWTIRGTTDK